MRKNIVITVLVIVVVGQSVLLYRATQLSKQNTITFDAADSLAFTAETQHQICLNTASQMRWLRQHLDKTISILENQYHLEPMPIRIPGLPPESATPEPLVTAYEPPNCHALNLDPEVLRTDMGLAKLAALMNLSSVSASMANDSMETRIDNFYQRLQRLEPLIEIEIK